MIAKSTVPTTPTVSGASLPSPDDLWAACLDGSILRYQGGHWTAYSIGGQAPEVEGQPLAISMLSDTDGWVGGFTNMQAQGMFLAHFDGHAWTRVRGPQSVGPTDINAMAMISASDG